jgi:2-polyprenyl-3-methyl-5-hydroxy-6-metoxy-1,4-benzoquinol methylase
MKTGFRAGRLPTPSVPLRPAAPIPIKSAVSPHQVADLTAPVAPPVSPDLQPPPAPPRVICDGSGQDGGEECPGCDACSNPFVDEVPGQAFPIPDRPAGPLIARDGSSPTIDQTLGPIKQEIALADEQETAAQLADVPEGWTPDPAQDKNSKRDVDQSRRFDTTQLKSTGHGYSVHRDYAAHFFRWGFAKRFIEKDSFVLDVGCGQEQPLARSLAHGVGGNIPALMVAVDYNPIKAPFNVKWLTTLDRFDFTTRWQECLDLLPKVAGWDGKFEVITCFEVIEHMHTCDGRRLLEAFRECMGVNSRLILSTPVFNGRAAANHIHEYTIPELDQFIHDAGLWAEKRYGTFASKNDLMKVLTPEQKADYERLCEFYDGDVAACFYAPMFPDASRNNVWVCRRSMSAP